MFKIRRVLIIGGEFMRRFYGKPDDILLKKVIAEIDLSPGSDIQRD